MVYQYDYPRPAVTVDAAVFAISGGTVKILLIQRKHDPFAGFFALPGGFVEMDESLDHAAKRELAEETGLDGVPLTQLGAYGDVGRDPRGRVISVVFWGKLAAPPDGLRADSDAAALGWFPLAALPPLAFDHNKIITDASALLHQSFLHI